MKNKKINVLTLITSSYGGGAERLVLNQMQSFDETKFNLHVITFRPGQLEQQFKKTKAKYHTLNIKQRISFSALLKLNYYIKRNKIKIIHAHLIEPEIYTLPLKILNPNLKIIITKHNANDFRKKIHWRILNKIISLFTDKIICVSNEIKEFSQKYEFITKNKIVVCPNGITIPKLKKINSKNLNIEKHFNKKEIGFNKKLKIELGLNEKDYVVGMVGRLTKQKGHLILMKAIKILKERIPNLKIIIIGEGELKKELETEVIRLNIKNNVKFLGFRNDVNNLYQIMDVFCMPSFWEGLSLVLLEAMSMNSFVIMSDLPNNKEVAIPNKEGIYFKKGNYHKLAQLIYYYYKNPEEKKIIQHNARKKVEKEFNWMNNLNKIETIYCEVLK